MIEKYFFNLSYFLFILIPLSLIFSPFFSDFSISFIALTYVIKRFNDRNFIKFERILLLLFLFYWIYLISISSFSKNPIHSFESSLFYIRFILFALGVPLLIIKFPNTLKYFFITLLTVFLVLSLDSLSILLFDINLLGQTNPFKGITGQRISSFFYSEQILGSYMVRLLPILIFLMIFYKSNKYINNFFFISIVCLSSITIFISGERSSIFYLLIIFLLSPIYTHRVFKNFIFSIFIFIVSILLVFNVNNGIKERIFDYTLSQFNDLIKELEYDKNIYNSEDIVVHKDNNQLLISKVINLPFFTVQHRAIYSTSFKIFLDNPIFGIGPKMFRIVCDNDKYFSYSNIDPSINGCQSHPHNTYFQLLSETGIVGTIPVIILLIIILFNIIKILSDKLSKLNFDQNDYLLSLYICSFITLWPIIPTGNFFHNWLCIIYYLPLGLLIYIQNFQKRNETNN